MPRCIYCQSEKADVAFSKREHVIPQSFGLFKNNFTLLNIVCDECNQYFGDNLELALARDSMEGISRFSHGVKGPEEFRPFGRNSRIIIRIAEGQYKGAYAYREYSAEAQKITLKPLPQVGFLMGGEYRYFLLDEIPTKKKLEEDGFKGENPKSIYALGMDKDVLETKLKEKDIVFQKGGDLIPSEASEALLCEIEATVDQKIFRAVAKIAFNYLANWQSPGFLNEDAFNPIRRYIRHGEKQSYPLVISKNEAILEDEPSVGTRRLGHLITVNWAKDDTSIVSQVSLFNWVTYCVSLAYEYKGERRELKKGHFFNVANGEILELGSRPKS